MSRLLDAELEEQTDRRRVKLGRAVDGGMESAVRWAGGELTGFSVRIGQYETLITLRAIVKGEPAVCFVASADLSTTILKVMGEAERGSFDGEQINTTHPQT